MEKYTVDIDKVLDDFEESEEALQVKYQDAVLGNIKSEHWQCTNAEITNNLLVTEISSTPLVQRHQEASQFVSATQDIILLNPPVSLSDNHIYVPQRFEAFSPQEELLYNNSDLISEVVQPVEQSQNQSSSNCRPHCITFQSPSFKSPETENKSHGRTSGVKSVDNRCLQYSQGNQGFITSDINGKVSCSAEPAVDLLTSKNNNSCTSLVLNSYLPVVTLNSVPSVQDCNVQDLCIAGSELPDGVCVPVCELPKLDPYLEIPENQSEQKLTSDFEFSEVNCCQLGSDSKSTVFSYLNASDSSESSVKAARKIVCAENFSSSNTVSPCLDGYKTSGESKQKENLCEETKENEKGTLLNVQTVKSLEINGDVDVSHASLKSEPAVGFLKDDDPSCISVDEMNDYLADVSEADAAQDEDSGVSSQEGDVNGNNLVSDLGVEETYKMRPCVSCCVGKHGSEQVLCKHGEIDITSETNKDAAEQIVCENSEYIQNIDTLPTGGEDASQTSNPKWDSPLESVNLCSGARPKQKEAAAGDTYMKDEKFSSLPKNSLTEVISTCENSVIINSESQQENLVTLDDTFSNVSSEKCDSVPVDCNSSENVKVNGLETSEGNILNYLEATDTSQFPMKLQRPTTLDLPARVLIKPAPSVDSATEDMSVSPNCEDVCEETTNETAVQSEQVISDQPPISDGCTVPSGDSKNCAQPREQLGFVKPFWIPDEDASSCMHCNVKFSVFRRRHHCRACGKVLCSRCCNQKAQLPYLQNKEDRVCQQCFAVLSEISQTDQTSGVTGDSPCSSSCGSSPNFSPSSIVNLNSSNHRDKNLWKPHPNNPEEYCSTIPPLQQIESSVNHPPPTVMVPVGVLKRGNKPKGEPKQVIFSDGIRPGGDLTDLTEPLEIVPPYRLKGRRRVDKVAASPAEDSHVTSSVAPSSLVRKKLLHPKNRHKRIIVSDSEGPLPPILLPLDSTTDLKPDIDSLLSCLQDTEAAPVVFAATKNMHILTKITKLDCCFGKECWCFTSRGLCTVGQDEVMVIVERMPNENLVPRDIFRLYSALYDNASKGVTVDELGHIIFPDGIFGSWEHRGFLFVRPTFQCLSNLVVPSTPFLVAILIQKWEVPWAKVFPLRLMLRLGAECRYYPCALVSIRFRKSVYFEIGQTILTVLADLRNYQFTIPLIPGVVIHMEEKKTSVNIPRNRYDKVMKVINSNNVEHVLALASNFSTEADSHLVCMQKDEGDYQTQAINIENTPRRVTGASFIVFSGALKSSSGLSAKFSIVEDGLLVQISQDMMAALHSALREMKDLTVPCGPLNAAEPEEVVLLQWTRDDKKFNLGVRSPVDGRSLEGVQSTRIHTSTDYAGEHYLIRWTEVFFLELDENGNSKQNDGIDPSRLSEAVAQACCMSLTPHLDQLAEADLTKLGLRVTLDADGDKVEYEVGSNGNPLPSTYMNALDNGLIPIISRVSGTSLDGPISLELIFHIIIK